MALFGKEGGPKNYLGVDIGGSSVKLVELANNRGRAQLVTYGYLERSLDGKGKRLLEDTNYLAKAIKKVVKEANIKTKDAVTAIPAASVFSTILNIPEITERDLANEKKVTAVVQQEAKKVLPMPVEEMVLDWKVINYKAGAEAKPDAKLKNVQVLLTAAPKTLVQQYIEIFKKADLNLVSLETESFGLARALVGKDKSTVVVIDIGASDTDIIIVDNMVPYMDRSVKVGGYQLTEAVNKAMDLTMAQAEQFKRDLAKYSGTLPEGKYLPPALEAVLQPIVNEVQYLFDFFKKQAGNENKKIDRIVLAGGNAMMFNLPNYFSEIFDQRVFLGNPFARVIYSEDLQPLIDQVGPRLAVAVGLAMREIEK